ncbi:nucleoside-diphosphate-sugar epimerase [Fusarium langsethiae]|uniref:Nucleoside-diphosphate-sugar epimerase n=1 Tax=Fusarium langsethiae TaxID=179993 RepID=A0A0N0DEC7_FUSLA|nr:nucleoside-diphosphate-sugar epimerase [Fusarium langsethiae]GKT98435.1 unnamed protein product [Fusarium langsethiae]GKU15004.1 unnamed protein product [Fusarium langsethiae]
MAPRIFLTGVNGYVGGTTFSMLHETHPEYDYALYVRNQDRAKIIAEKFPDVKFVYGDLGSVDVTEKAASEADVVVRMRRSPWYDIKHNRYGEPPLPEQSYNDIKDTDRILNMPDEAVHKDVENTIQSIDSDAVKYLMVSPPVIYGAGRGLIHKQSFAVTEIVRATVDLGFTPIIGAGKVKWDNVHVEDLAALFAKAVEASQSPSKKEDDSEIWGKNGYYFWIAEEVHRQGFIPEPKTKSVSMEDMINGGYKAALAWGTNSKSEAERARKYLGWESKALSLEETIADIVAAETVALGLKPKYK